MTAPLPAGGSSLFRYNQLLSKLLNYKGGEPLEATAPELQPTLPVDDDRLWHARLRNEGAFSVLIQATGDATHAGQACLQNPVSSGVIVLLEGIIICSPDAQNDYAIRVNALPTTALDAVDDVRFRDNRIRGKPTTQAGQRTTSNAVGVNIARVQTLLGHTQYVPCGWVLGEANEVNVGTVVANRTIYCTFWGRERPAEKGELAPL